jgi:hypothetical protein
LSEIGIIVALDGIGETHSAAQLISHCMPMLSQLHAWPLRALLGLEACDSLIYSYTHMIYSGLIVLKSHAAAAARTGNLSTTCTSAYNLLI